MSLRMRRETGLSVCLCQGIETRSSHKPCLNAATVLDAVQKQTAGSQLVKCSSNGMTIVLPLLALFAWGCSKGPIPGREKTVPVTGLVTFNGEPVAEAAVVFTPDAAGETAQGQGAFATTDKSGRFQMMTYEPGDGVVPGRYKALVTKVEAGELPPPEEGEYVPPSGIEVIPPPKHLLPVRYSTPRTTPFSVEIVDGDGQTVDFELEGTAGGTSRR